MRIAFVTLSYIKAVYPHPLIVKFTKEISFIDLLISRFLQGLSYVLYKKKSEETIRNLQDLIINFTYPHSEFKTLIEALIQAEDHRFYSHYGVDFYAIIRAIVVNNTTKNTQGASTITQQLVRVITGNYKKTISRKFQELCLASWVNYKIPKTDQAIAYLHIAYFGWRMNGLKQAITHLQLNFPCQPIDAAAVIARLKYPQPKHPNLEQIDRINARKNHILKMLDLKNEHSSS